MIFRGTGFGSVLFSLYYAVKYDHFIGNVEFKTVGDKRGVTKCASVMKPVTESHPAITPDTTDCICDDVINPMKIRNNS